MAAGRGRIVEFTGPPGGGKSTLAARCSELLTGRGLRVPPRETIRELYLRQGAIGRLAGPQLREKNVAGQRLEYFKQVETPFLLWLFRARHPRGWRRYREELERIRREDPGQAETLERWVEQSILTWRMLRSQARRMDLFLWEEGIAHRSVNLFAQPGRPLEPERLRAFLRAWALPDALVHVDAPPADCFKRIASRGLPERLAGRSESEVLAFIEAGARVSREIAAEARRRQRPVLEFANRFASAEELRASGACDELVDRLVRVVRAGPRSGA